MSLLECLPEYAELLEVRESKKLADMALIQRVEAHERGRVGDPGTGRPGSSQ